MNVCRLAYISTDFNSSYICALYYTRFHIAISFGCFGKVSRDMLFVLVSTITVLAVFISIYLARRDTHLIYCATCDYKCQNEINMWVSDIRAETRQIKQIARKRKKTHKNNDRREINTNCQLKYVVIINMPLDVALSPLSLASCSPSSLLKFSQTYALAMNWAKNENSMGKLMYPKTHTTQRARDRETEWVSEWEIGGQRHVSDRTFTLLRGYIVYYIYVYKNKYR